MVLKCLSMQRNFVLNLIGKMFFNLEFSFLISNYFSLLSFALIAYEQNNYTRPELTVTNRIEIIDGKLVS
jgi:DNA mismatch repair ATPase MutS